MLRFVKILLLLLPAFSKAQQLGFALEQINSQIIIDQKLTGKGVKVGVIDGGFLNANKEESLAHIFADKLIAGYRDFIDSTDFPYSGSKALDDGHGTEVLELIAGYNQKKSVQYGLATEAMYYLARTDHGGYERRSEEENAIKAMEWMASNGVKIINISLGYNYGYSRKAENYVQSDIDGRSTILTQAVDRISEEYGILFIVAAGNDGSKKWRILGSPADAKAALTVGASKFKIWDEAGYSSRGPEWLEYVKPEVTCFASSGTSFSTPIITGLAACLLQRNPKLSGAALKEVIIKSCKLSLPNNYIGYGPPDAEIALSIVSSDAVPEKKEINSTRKVHKIELKTPVPYVAVYHQNGWVVKEKVVKRLKKNSFRVRRNKISNSCTIISQHQQFQIVWQE
ncbi:MAG: S8 family serine peptidase [Bacteroidota bacterium]